MSLRDDYCKRAWEWFDRADEVSLQQRPSAIDIANAWVRLALGVKKPDDTWHKYLKKRSAA